MAAHAEHRVRADLETDADRPFVRHEAEGSKAHGVALDGFCYALFTVDVRVDRVVAINAEIHGVERDAGDFLELAPEERVDFVFPLRLGIEDKRGQNRVAALLRGHNVDVVLNIHRTEHGLDVFLGSLG